MRIIRTLNQNIIAVSVFITFSMVAMPGFADQNSIVKQGLQISDDTVTQFDQLASGEQLVLTDRNGIIQFAGRTFNLSGFSGIVGFASEIAYVVTITGTAETEGKSAKSGQMVMIPPFGGNVAVERFDAARLRDAWDEGIKISAAKAYAALDDLVKKQSRGLFLGRLGRTTFNVTASGRASQELAKRSIVGGATVTNIRFSSKESSDGIEQHIVNDFINALMRGDAQSVAEIMDPMPFGNSDLRSGGDEARLLLAQSLIGERNWKTIIGNAEAKRDQNIDDLWVIRGPVSRTYIKLRRTTDFAFVSTIRTGS